MEQNRNNPNCFTHAKSPEALADLLREDICELVDGLVPRGVVDHLQRAVVAIEGIDGARDAVDPDSRSRNE